MVYSLWRHKAVHKRTEGLVAKPLEYQVQLSESLPSAIPIFARAIGKSEAELFKLMEQGKLLAVDVLPKVAKEMKKVAATGLEEKLKSTRVAQGRFFNELETAQNTIFKEGFGEGLGDLFNSMASQIQISDGALEGLGETFKLVFNVIRNITEMVIPIFNGLMWVIGNLAKVLNKVFESDLSKILLVMGAFTLGAKAMATAVGTLTASLVALASTSVFGALMAILRKFPAIVLGEEIVKTAAGNENTAAVQGAKKLGGFLGLSSVSQGMVTGNSMMPSSIAQGYNFLTSSMFSNQSSNTKVEVSIDGVKQTIKQQTEQQWQAAYNSGG